MYNNSIEDLCPSCGETTTYNLFRIDNNIYIMFVVFVVV